MRIIRMRLAIASADSFGSPARHSLTLAREVARMKERSFHIASELFSEECDLPRQGVAS
jgi:hypothetical protein